MMDTTGVLEALAIGGVVALPTDTVYGIAASLQFPEAVAALFVLKRRPATLALPVLVSSVDQIESLGVVWDGRAGALSRAFWPGALTIVVDVPENLSHLVGSTTRTVGFRCPDDAMLRHVLEQSGPLALTSANAHGDAPCQSAVQVLEAFDDLDGLDGVLDGGERSGRVSTVVDVSGATCRVVREGAISEAALAAVLG
jgi:tRNA threonylcarbamoyl adenosine modification protein (Sua5/YciO/YrdC/YwlC family)